MAVSITFGVTHSMTAKLFLVLFGILWLVQAARVFVWLYRSQESFRRLPQPVRRNMTRLTAKDWPSELSVEDRQFATDYRRRFVIEYYLLLAFPACALGIGVFLFAVLGYLTGRF